MYKDDIKIMQSESDVFTTKTSSINISGVMKAKSNLKYRVQNVQKSPSPMKLKLYEYAFSLGTISSWHMKRWKILQSNMSLHYIEQYSQMWELKKAQIIR